MRAMAQWHTIGHSVFQCVQGERFLFFVRSLSLVCRHEATAIGRGATFAALFFSLWWF